MEEVMKHHAGIDVSLELSSVCILDDSGNVIREAKVASDPAALAKYFLGLETRVVRVGLEAGPLSQWIHAGLTAAGFETVLLETRHVKAALSAMAVKTDRKDARGIAQLMRMGWFRPVHAKSATSQEIRALLTARKMLQGKVLDVERSLRGILRGFGLKVGRVTPRTYEARIRDLASGQPVLEAVAAAMLAARATLRREFASVHQAILTIVRDDEVCSRLMTLPGVGPLVSITFKTAIDDPSRIAKSKSVGALFGLTPRKYQSGEREVTGAITCAGDAMVRLALYEAATSLLSRAARPTPLKRWATEVAKRRGTKRARVALARKLGVIMHRMWVDGTTYQPAQPASAAA
jgi:transposase